MWTLGNKYLTTRAECRVQVQSKIKYIRMILMQRRGTLRYGRPPTKINRMTSERRYYRYDICTHAVIYVAMI